MTLASEIDASVSTLQWLKVQEPTLTRMSDAVIGALRTGHKIMACGNGGSSSEAAHFVTELMGRFDRTRPSLPAVSLGADASMVTCIANDFDFDDIFARPFRALAHPGDVLVCFSTSGNAKNLSRVLETAKELGVVSVALLGKNGGRARGLATHELVVDSDDTARIQEAHLFLVHWLCGEIDSALYGTTP